MLKHSSRHRQNDVSSSSSSSSSSSEESRDRRRERKSHQKRNSSKHHHRKTDSSSSSSSSQENTFLLTKQNISNSEKTLQALLALIPDMHQSFVTDVVVNFIEKKPMSKSTKKQEMRFLLAERIMKSFDELATDLNLLHGEVFEESARQSNEIDGKSKKIHRDKDRHRSTKQKRSHSRSSLENNDDDDGDGGKQHQQIPDKSSNKKMTIQQQKTRRKTSTPAPPSSATSNVPTTATPKIVTTMSREQKRRSVATPTPPSSITPTTTTTTTLSKRKSSTSSGASALLRKNRTTTPIAPKILTRKVQAKEDVSANQNKKDGDDDDEKENDNNNARNAAIPLSATSVMPCYKYKNPNQINLHHNNKHNNNNNNSNIYGEGEQDISRISFENNNNNNSKVGGFSTSFLTSDERDKQLREQQQQQQQQPKPKDSSFLRTPAPEEEELLILKKKIERLNRSSGQHDDNDYIERQNSKQNNDENNMQWIYGGKYKSPTSTPPRQRNNSNNNYEDDEHDNDTRIENEGQISVILPVNNNNNNNIDVSKNNPSSQHKTQEPVKKKCNRQISPENEVVDDDDDDEEVAAQKIFSRKISNIDDDESISSTSSAFGTCLPSTILLIDILGGNIATNANSEMSARTKNKNRTSQSRGTNSIAFELCGKTNHDENVKSLFENYSSKITSSTDKFCLFPSSEANNFFEFDPANFEKKNEDESVVMKMNRLSVGFGNDNQRNKECADEIFDYLFPSSSSSSSTLKNRDNKNKRTRQQIIANSSKKHEFSLNVLSFSDSGDNQNNCIDENFFSEDAMTNFVSFMDHIVAASPPSSSPNTTKNDFRQATKNNFDKRSLKLLQQRRNEKLLTSTTATTTTSSSKTKKRGNVKTEKSFDDESSSSSANDGNLQLPARKSDETQNARRSDFLASRFISHMQDFVGNCKTERKIFQVGNILESLDISTAEQENGELQEDPGEFKLRCGSNTIDDENQENCSSSWVKIKFTPISLLSPNNHFQHRQNSSEIFFLVFKLTSVVFEIPKNLHHVDISLVIFDHHHRRRENQNEVNNNERLSLVYPLSRAIPILNFSTTTKRKNKFFAKSSTESQDQESLSAWFANKELVYTFPTKNDDDNNNETIESTSFASFRVPPTDKFAIRCSFFVRSEEIDPQQQRQRRPLSSSSSPIPTNKQASFAISPLSSPSPAQTSTRNFSHEKNSNHFQQYTSGSTTSPFTEILSCDIPAKDLIAGRSCRAQQNNQNRNEEDDDDASSEEENMKFTWQGQYCGKLEEKSKNNRSNHNNNSSVSLMFDVGAYSVNDQILEMIEKEKQNRQEEIMRMQSRQNEAKSTITQKSNYQNQAENENVPSFSPFPVFSPPPPPPKILNSAPIVGRKLPTLNQRNVIVARNSSTTPTPKDSPKQDEQMQEKRGNQQYCNNFRIDDDGENVKSFSNASSLADSSVATSDDNDKQTKRKLGTKEATENKNSKNDDDELTFHPSDDENENVLGNEDQKSRETDQKVEEEKSQRVIPSSDINVEKGNDNNDKNKNEVAATTRPILVLPPKKPNLDDDDDDDSSDDEDPEKKPNAIVVKRTNNNIVVATPPLSRIEETKPAQTMEPNQQEKKQDVSSLPIVTKPVVPVPAGASTAKKPQDSKIGKRTIVLKSKKDSDDDSSEDHDED